MVEKINGKNNQVMEKEVQLKTAMFMWKQAFSPKLLSRKFENQKSGAAIKVRMFNKLTYLGMPQTEACPT